MSAGPSALPLGPMYGSIYFGTVMSTAFYGVACMQTFFYYVHYENDPLRLKIFVAIIWALNTIHEALSVSGAYKLIIAGLEDPFSFLNGNPELVLLYLVTALAAIPTQGYLVYRVYLFTEKNAIVLLIWVILALIELVSSIIYVSKALYSANGVHVVGFSVLNTVSFTSIDTLTLSSAAGVDVLVAVIMTFLLVRQWTAVKFTSTAHILQRLIVFAVNTGTWTATFALLSVVLLHIFPSTLIYTVFIIPLCSVYCNTLLANLNARAYVLGERTTHNVDLDLSLGLGSRATKGDKRQGDSAANLGTWRARNVVSFSDTNRSATLTNA